MRHSSTLSDQKQNRLLRVVQKTIYHSCTAPTGAFNCCSPCCHRLCVFLVSHLRYPVRAAEHRTSLRRGALCHIRLARGGAHHGCVRRATIPCATAGASHLSCHVGCSARSRDAARWGYPASCLSFGHSWSGSAWHAVGRVSDGDH